jgi:hypothetical protein
MYDSANGLTCRSISSNRCIISARHQLFDWFSSRFVFTSAESKIQSCPYPDTWVYASFGHSGETKRKILPGRKQYGPFPGGDLISAANSFNWRGAETYLSVLYIQITEKLPFDLSVWVTRAVWWGVKRPEWFSYSLTNNLTATETHTQPLAQSLDINQKLQSGSEISATTSVIKDNNSGGVYQIPHTTEGLVKGRLQHLHISNY